ncbi:TIGR01620 family protein [Lonepinella koalarum]|uniref:YcjF family protein n=1 Tax=Lonepinella koalarum TaxID=53417 RepID=UPI0011E4126E|nr:TIGR01620 family protein [Lonepinella koalarum]TYG33778.1 TIGR01620 family protein [Lonepinella koalarum]
MNDKIIFDDIQQTEQAQFFQAKQEFNQENVEIEIDQEPLEGELLDEKFEQAIGAKSNWWTRALMIVFSLLLIAIVAQSIQWMLDTWQQHQWIYFVFALVSFFVVVLGLTAIGKEFLRLRNLRQHLLMQKQSADWQMEPSKSAVQFSQDLSNEESQQFCLNVAKAMQLDLEHPTIVQWQKQLSESHHAQEVGFLFSQTVMQPFDKKAKQLITKNAIESAIVIAVSPLAVVDTFFMAWRNIRLINQIARLYGIELGYFSRLRLMKLVLMNMALTGATELIQEVGMDWLSQDVMAKLSARVGQGIGAGLLTARLGIKTMEFCRPLAFQKGEKPRLSHIHREVLSHLKATVLNTSKITKKEKL